MIAESSRLRIAPKTVIEKQVNTTHKGKGVFTFTPQPHFSYYLELELGRAGTVKKYLNFTNISTNSRLFKPRNPDLTFTILNKHKVLGNNDDLRILFQTNSYAKESSTYMLRIF